MFEELRRRNVHRVAIAYLAGAWLLVQVVETLLPAFEWSAQVLRLVLVLLAVGFVPALILAWVFEWTPEGFRRETDMPSRAPRTASKYFDRLIAIILVIAVTYFAVDKFAIDPARDKAEIAAATEEAAKRALSDSLFAEFSDRSILILPFLNMSSDPDQAFFADGISEELLNMLSRMDELRVISRSTSWTFKGKEIDVAEIHQKLNVSHILEGSVRKAGNEVRITAQLIDARTDTHLWSETYDRTFNDVFAIQDEISLAVADQLHLELIVPDSPHEDVDPLAYESYLRARSDPTTGHGAAVRSSEARRLLHDALDIEPDYVPAMYQLTYEYEQLRVSASPQEEPAIRQTILELGERMVNLAPDSVYASNWQAYIAMRWHYDLLAAAPHLENSMRYANRTDVHVWFRGAIELLYRLGRDEEGMILARYWIDRDPACVGCLAGAAAAMRDAGRHEEAARIMESMLEWREADSAGYWNIGVAFLVAGDAEKALYYFDQIEDDQPFVDRDFARAFALYSLGQHKDFESILARRLSSQSNPEGIARLYAWSGQSNEAFEWLERMVAEYGAEYANAVKTDLYEPIKSDPRWQEFLEKHGASDKPIPRIDFNPDYPPILQNAVDALVANR